jgi:hypothetical protein
MLRTVDMYLVTDVSGQPIAPTFEGQAVLTLEYWTDNFRETSVTNHVSNMRNIAEERSSFTIRRKPETEQIRINENGEESNGCPSPGNGLSLKFIAVKVKHHVR